MSNYRRNQPTGKQFLFFAVLSVLFLLPVYQFTSFSWVFLTGDDYSFHFYRIASMAQDLQSSGGVHYLAPYGPAQVMYGVNLFYPFLTTVLPISLLHVLIPSIINSFYVYLILLNFISLWIAYMTSFYFFLSVQKESSVSKIKLMAMVFSILFVFSQYRLVCIFTRFALGEMVAFSFLPLVFVGFYDILFQKGEKFYWLIVGLTLIAYTHLLSLELLFFVLLFFFLVHIRQMTKEKWLLLLKSAGLTILLTAASLLPIIEQMRFMSLKSVDEYVLRDQAKSIGTLFLEGVSNDLNTYSIGIVICMLLVIGSLAVFFKRLSFVSRPVQRIFFAGFFFFVAASSLFPWNVVQHTPLKVIQFPFRLFPYVTLFVLAYGAVLLVHLLHMNGKGLILGVAFVSVLLSFSAVRQLMATRQAQEPVGEFLVYSDEEAQSTSIFPIYHNLDYIADSEEEQYMPIFGKKGLVNGEEWEMDYVVIGGETDFQFVLPKTAEILLPIVAYKGVEVYEDEEKLPMSVSEAGTIQLTLPSGTHQIVVKMNRTRIMLFSYLLTFIGMVMLLFWIGKIKKKRE